MNSPRPNGLEWPRRRAFKVLSAGWMASAAAIPPASQYTLLRLGMCFTSSARLWPSDEKKLPLGFAASSPTAAGGFCCCPVATTGGDAGAVESCAAVRVAGASKSETATASVKVRIRIYSRVAPCIARAFRPQARSHSLAHGRYPMNVNPTISLSLSAVHLRCPRCDQAHHAADGKGHTFVNNEGKNTIQRSAMASDRPDRVRASKPR